MLLLWAFKDFYIVRPQSAKIRFYLQIVFFFFFVEWHFVNQKIRGLKGIVFGHCFISKIETMCRAQNVRDKNYQKPKFR